MLRCAAPWIWRASHCSLYSSFEGYVGTEFARSLRGMGCHAPNEVQEKALSLATEVRGKGILLLAAQTGSGKTLAALLPLLHRLHRSSEEGCMGRGSDALVIAPTRELARQHAGVASQLLAGTAQLVACIFDATDAAAAAALPPSSLFVATPAGALQLVHSGQRRKRSMRFVVIDEVDAVLCGGALDEVVTPAAEDLLRALALGEQSDGEGLLILTTAHLTPAHEVALSRRFPGARRVQQGQASGGGRGGALVPTLRQRFHYFSGGAQAKEEKLLTVLADDAAVAAARRRDGEEATGAMVFCASAEQVAHLQSRVAEALPTLRPVMLHDAMADEQRAASLCAFRSAEARVLLCTDVAARGLDFPALAHVVMYDLPVDVVSYVHCAGRTARRGSAGFVTCLVASRAEASSFRKLHALQHAANVW